MLSTKPHRCRLLAVGFYAAILSIPLILLGLLPGLLPGLQSSNLGLAQSSDQSQPLPDQSSQYQPSTREQGRLRSQAPSGPPPADIASAAAGNSGILASTTQHIDGYHASRYLGVVRGVKVFQPTIGESFRAGFKGIIGGNIGAYTEMCEKARQQAYDQLLARSTALGANAVLGLHFDSSSFSLGSSEMGTEVICYGTAVYLEADR
jgi:uncharacterized protein YbjQ (UPF0145 family)